MNILLRQPTIVDPSSPFHLKKADVLIQNGIIKDIKDSIEADADHVVDCSDAYLSQGWVDLFAQFSDPGQEYKETLETGANAAAAGGYTDVLLLPNTSPVVHSKGAVEYIVQRSKTLPVRLHPIGAVTKNTDGKELSEMYDMHQSGAVAFSDGLNSIQSAGLLLKAMQYLKAVDATLIQLPDDKSINPNGLMHEGIESTKLGLPGRPALAEELQIARDIELLKYSGSKLHITGVSTAKSVELIREAKKEGMQISCSVTPYHLLFTDEDLKEYDTNLKVNPPLRTRTDREALKNAVLDGTIDCIASHHIPQDIDHKICEFEYAHNGMISIQTVFAAVCGSLPGLKAERVAELFSSNARKIFGLQHDSIKAGSDATLTLFITNAPWNFNKQNNQSRSNNSPFLDKQLQGRVIGIISKGDLLLPNY